MGDALPVGRLSRLRECFFAQLATVPPRPGGGFAKAVIMVWLVGNCAVMVCAGAIWTRDLQWLWGEVIAEAVRLLYDALIAFESRVLATSLADDASSEATTFCSKDVSIIWLILSARTTRLFLCTRRTAEMMAVHVFTEIDLNAIDWRRDTWIAWKRFFLQKKSP